MVVIGEGTLMDDLIDSLEELFPFHVNAGICTSKPFEELLPERAAYIRSLGVLDYLEEERQRLKNHRNIFKRTFNKTLNFLDKYF